MLRTLGVVQKEKSIKKNCKRNRSNSVCGWCDAVGQEPTKPTMSIMKWVLNSW